MVGILPFQSGAVSRLWHSNIQPDVLCSKTPGLAIFGREFFVTNGSWN
jgi:hypothetical protein